MTEENKDQPAAGSVNEIPKPTAPIDSAASADNTTPTNGAPVAPPVGEPVIVQPEVPSSPSAPIQEPRKWYQQTWVIVLFLIFFWPVGIALVWTSKWQKNAKIIVTIVLAILVIIGVFNMGTTMKSTTASISSSSSTTSQSTGTSSSSSSASSTPAASSATQAPSTASSATSSASSAASAAQAPSTAASVPTEYKNALKKAQQYNDRMHMSYAGLYDQLTSEYGEKYPPDAAQYAVDNVKADWNANALAKAKSYQSQMAMSSSAIYDQLVSEYGEKFTPEQAQYAIDHL